MTRNNRVECGICLTTLLIPQGAKTIICSGCGFEHFFPGTHVEMIIGDTNKEVL
jgi:LSD1 subclass zinc finger protein